MIRTRHLKPLKPRILAMLREADEHGLALREIRDGLGLAKGQARSLQAYLSELGQLGQVRYHRRRYWPAVAGEGDGKGGGRKAKESGKGSARKGAAKGRDRAEPRGRSRGVEDEAPELPRAPRRARDAKRGGGARGAGEEGVFVAHRRGFGFVELDVPGRALFVPPGQGGGALDGDRVIVVRQQEPGDGRDVGAVQTVVERRRTHVRGHLEVDRGEMWLAPLNEKLPLIYVGAGTPPADAGEGSLVEAQVTAYPANDNEAPVGELLRALPDDDDPEHIIDHILSDRQIDPGHSERAVADAERAARQRVTPKGREDLQDLPFITIDGEDARDFDDAVCLETHKDGSARLLVAIADVAHYVRPHTTLDKEAYQKGTSVYLPDRALPMLPEALSTDACSLRPHEPRLTLTCDMEVDRMGIVKRHRAYESVIRSHARLTYNQVQRFFESDDPGGLPAPELADMLRRMRVLAREFRQRRHKRGALNLGLPELRFRLDDEGRPTGIMRVWPTEATQLIEQFMLEANEQIAADAERLELNVLYRVHDPPPPDKIVTLQVILHNAGISVSEEALATSSGVADVIDRLADHPRRTELEIAVLRAMSQAQYRPHNEGHFGLASENYTHFTSPIRRYPDLILHRALKAYWHEGKRLPMPERAGPHLSDCERMAADAEQAVQRLYRVMVMEQWLGENFPATVAGISDAALWVELSDPPVEGPVPVETLPFDRYRFDKRSQTLRSARRRREIRIGDRLTVQLARADRATQTLEFVFANWGWPGDPHPEVHEAEPAKPRKRKSSRRR